MPVTVLGSQWVSSQKLLGWCLACSCINTVTAEHPAVAASPGVGVREEVTQNQGVGKGKDGTTTHWEWPGGRRSVGNWK